jgi:hypothetical protein
MGARVDYSGPQARATALHCAVEEADQEIVSLLLGAGSNPDVTFAGMTALSCAIHEIAEESRNHVVDDPSRSKRLLAIVDLLVAAGADPAGGGPDQTPLELCRLYRIPELERRLEGALKTRME